MIYLKRKKKIFELLPCPAHWQACWSSHWPRSSCPRPSFLLLYIYIYMAVEVSDPSSSFIAPDGGYEPLAEAQRGGEVDVFGGCWIGDRVSAERGTQGGRVSEGSCVPERAVGFPRVPRRRKGNLRQPPLSAPWRATHRHRWSRPGRARLVGSSF